MVSSAKTTYGAIYCEDCKKTHFYKIPSTEKERARDAMTCPECDKTQADRILACNYTFLGSKKGNKGDWVCDLDDDNIEDLDILIGAVGRMGL